MNAWQLMLDSLGGSSAEGRDPAYETMTTNGKKRLYVPVGEPRINRQGRVILGDGRVVYVDDPKDTVIVDGREYSWPNDMTLDLRSLSQGEMPAKRTQPMPTEVMPRRVLPSERAIAIPGGVQVAVPPSSQIDVNGEVIPQDSKLIDVSPWLKMKMPNRRK